MKNAFLPLTFLVPFIKNQLAITLGFISVVSILFLLKALKPGTPDLNCKMGTIKPPLEDETAVW